MGWQPRVPVAGCAADCFWFCSDFARPQSDIGLSEQLWGQRTGGGASICWAGC